MSKTLTQVLSRKEVPWKERRLSAIALSSREEEKANSSLRSIELRVETYTEEECRGGTKAYEYRLREKKGWRVNAGA